MMDLSVLDNLKTKELRKEYKAFLGEDKHTEYYLKCFENMEDKGSKLNLNFAAFFFSTYWCFYRKLFGPGAIFLLMNFAGLYLTIMQPQLATLGSLCLGLYPRYRLRSFRQLSLLQLCPQKCSRCSGKRL